VRGSWAVPRWLLGAHHLTATDQYDRLRLLGANLARNPAPGVPLHPDRRGRFHHQPGMDSVSSFLLLVMQRAAPAAIRKGARWGPVQVWGKGGGVCPSVRRERGREERSVCVDELMWGEPLEGGVRGLGGPFDLAPRL